MSINPDIEETRIFRKLAREIIENCDLEEVTYAEREYYCLLFVWSKSISGKSVDELQKLYPAMMDAMSALDNLFRLFDWPSLAIVVDQLRGKQMIKLI